MPARTDRSPSTAARLAQGVAVLALGLGALTACSSDTTDDPASAATTSSSASASAPSASGSASASSDAGSSEAESITAEESDFRISVDEDDLRAGSYEITVVNHGKATHDLAVEQDGTTIATSDHVQAGGSTTLTVDLAPGEYVFYCSIGNHRAMGMELTVQVT